MEGTSFVSGRPPEQRDVYSELISGPKLEEMKRALEEIRVAPENAEEFLKARNAIATELAQIKLQMEVPGSPQEKLAAQQSIMDRIKVQNDRIEELQLKNIRSAIDAEIAHDAGTTVEASLRTRLHSLFKGPAFPEDVYGRKIEELESYISELGIDPSTLEEKTLFYNKDGSANAERIAAAVDNMHKMKTILNQESDEVKLLNDIEKGSTIIGKTQRAEFAIALDEKAGNQKGLTRGQKAFRIAAIGVAAFYTGLSLLMRNVPWSIASITALIFAVKPNILKNKSDTYVSKMAAMKPHLDAVEKTPTAIAAVQSLEGMDPKEFGSLGFDKGDEVQSAFPDASTPFHVKVLEAVGMTQNAVKENTKTHPLIEQMKQLKNDEQRKDFLEMFAQKDENMRSFVKEYFNPSQEVQQAMDSAKPVDAEPQQSQTTDQ